MKGWLFVTTSFTLEFQTQEFLNENPGYISMFADRGFDTDKPADLVETLRMLKPYDFKNPYLIAFCNKLGFDLIDYRRKTQAEQADADKLEVQKKAELP